MPFGPTSLLGYPMLMRLLVLEHVEGRLTFEPELVTTEREWLSPATRTRIAERSLPLRSIQAGDMFEARPLACRMVVVGVHAACGSVLAGDICRDVSAVTVNHVDVVRSLLHQAHHLLSAALGTRVVTDL